MKPLELEMQAFGTFAKKTTIDFSKLNEKVFLIYGKTGSGKTTIFDAICYALYGKVTGELRDKNVTENIRSTYSDNETPTYVKYKFSIKNDVYLIERTPGKQNINKKISAYKNERINVYKNDERIPLNKLEELNSYIKDEVIKLSIEQFKQTMMISQGDFAALIKADSGERTAIFRRILETNKLEEIGLELKSKALEFKKEIDLTKNTFSESIKKLPQELFTQDYYLKCVTSSGNYLILPEILENVTNKINENKINRTKLIEKKNDYNKQVDILNQRLGIIRNNNILVNDYKKNIEAFDNLKLKLLEITSLKEKIDLSKRSKEVKIKLDIYNEAQKAYEKINCLIETNEKELAKLLLEKPDVEKKYAEIKKLESNLDFLKQTYDSLNKNLENIDKLEKANLELKKLSSQIEELTVFLNKLEKNKEETLMIIEEANKFVVNNANIMLDLRNNNEEIREKKNLIELLTSIKIKKKEIDNENNLIVKKEKEFFALDNEYKNLQGDYLILEGKFLKSQAGILASTLKDNFPCPVCGSLTHPNKAVLLDNKLTEDLVKKAKTEAEIKNKELTQVNIELNRLKDNEKNKIELLLAEIDKNFSIKLEFQNVEEFVDQTTKNIEKEIANLNLIKKSLDEKYNFYVEQKNIVNDKSRLNTINKEIEDKTIDLNGKKASYNIKQGEIEQLKTQIINQDKTEVLNLVEKTKKDISHNEGLILEYREYKNNFTKKETTYTSVIKQAKIDEVSANNRNVKALEELESSESKYKISKEDALKYLLSNRELSTYEGIISKFEKEYFSLEALIIEAKNKGVDKLVIENIEDLTSEILDKQNDIKKLDENIASINELENNTNRQIIEIKELEKKYKDLAYLYEPYVELSDVFNGELSGKKITFETFYQVQFFKQILKIASRRFNKMTDGKYSLLYREDLDGGKKKTGLDMVVLDNYNGVKRNIGTLSGGESFMASLALALSMSDIIQTKAGGISLDSMFIDEGFGTLDPEALSNAIDQIVALSYSGKTIGLISHVEELKNRIPNQIHVIKKENGSIIE